MENKFILKQTNVNDNCITYHYEVLGPWAEAFKKEELFYIEYSCDIANVPEGVAVVPLLANVLPMAWIYDAEIVVSTCDQEFYDSIEAFKQGYMDMYPMIQFGGKLTVNSLQKNVPTKQEGVCAFFSGGVDAFNTLICHVDEKPTLITLWGSDVKFEDIIGWEKVYSHLQQTATEYEVDYVTVKSAFRRFQNEDVLNQAIKMSGDGWWHGFQHGIGIISHAAPVMYVLGKETVYFASSFTAADKGKVTCASDPTIDNYVRFCGAHVVHDGYEFTRQMKVHNITQFTKATGKKIPLRVCWKSTGGSNCCNCEKCWRTILGIYAEGFDPKDFGFDYSDEQLKRISKRMRYSKNKMFGELRYRPIQNAMKMNCQKDKLPQEIRWFFDADIMKLGKGAIWYRVIQKILWVSRKVIHRLYRK